MVYIQYQYNVRSLPLYPKPLNQPIKRQNSASQSLSRTIQLTGQRRESVCQRLVLVVLKFTWAVEPTGLYGSSTALTG